MAALKTALLQHIAQKCSASRCSYQDNMIVMCFQICQPVFLLCSRGPGQWAHHAGDHPQICGAAGQILWQRMFLFVWYCVKHLQFVQFGCMIEYISDSKVVFMYFFNFLFFEQQVCELDIIFNFEKAYFILDEFLLGGEAQETSKKNVLKAIEQADLLQEVRHLMSSSMLTATIPYFKQGFCDLRSCYSTYFRILFQNIHWEKQILKKAYFLLFIYLVLLILYLTCLLHNKSHDMLDCDLKDKIFANAEMVNLHSKLSKCII